MRKIVFIFFLIPFSWGCRSYSVYDYYTMGNIDQALFLMSDSTFEYSSRFDYKAKYNQDNINTQARYFEYRFEGSYTSKGDTFLLRNKYKTDDFKYNFCVYTLQNESDSISFNLRSEGSCEKGNRDIPIYLKYSKDKLRSDYRCFAFYTKSKKESNYIEIIDSFYFPTKTQYIYFDTAIVDSIVLREKTLAMTDYGGFNRYNLIDEIKLVKIGTNLITERGDTLRFAYRDKNRKK